MALFSTSCATLPTHGWGLGPYQPDDSGKRVYNPARAWCFAVHDTDLVISRFFPLNTRRRAGDREPLLRNVSNFKPRYTGCWHSRLGGHRCFGIHVAFSFFLSRRPSSNRFHISYRIAIQKPLSMKRLHHTYMTDERQRGAAGTELGVDFFFPLLFTKYRPVFVWMGGSGWDDSMSRGKRHLEVGEGDGRVLAY